MALITGRRVENADTFDRRQVVKLAKGLYGGMLSRYTMPKMYRKFQSEEEEEKFFAWFVVTHDRANQRLPHFSECVVTVRPKLFYDPVSGNKSALVALLYALHGGKIACEQIVDKGEYEMNDYIGRPAILFVEPSTKADKHGLFANRLKSIEPCDAGLKAAITPLWRERRTETSQTTGIVSLAYPSAAFEDDIAVTSAVTQPGTDHDDFDF